MKIILLLFLSLISFISLAQVGYTTTPKYACANSTHDVLVSATNNQTTIPAGFSYTITITLKDNSGTVVKTFSQNYTDGFAVGTTKTYTLDAIAFGAASTWKIGGSVAVSGFGTFPVPDQNYFVKNVPILTITNTNQDLSVVTTIDGYSVRYFLDGDYGTIINESTTGNYTALADGIYTAKAVNYVYISSVLSTCISATPSNGISILVTAIESAQDVSISVYPNPMTSSLTLSSGIPDELTCELYDKNGVALYKNSFKQSEQINVEHFKAGAYVLIIKKDNQKIATYNLVK
ncbi:MAG: hypothetical protein JWM14_1757 [Chitinophagaceae bacterium]|nr:hypothetical protein [Chitinophagaceae bacterium]